MAEEESQTREVRRTRQRLRTTVARRLQMVGSSVISSMDPGGVTRTNAVLFTFAPGALVTIQLLQGAVRIDGERQL